MAFYRILHTGVLLLACYTGMAVLAGSTAWAGHGYALWGDLKYPAGFTHFDYTNPAAPKNGELKLVSNLRYSTFDKYNPFTIKGSPPAYLSSLLFDSLLVGSGDEVASAYGLLADDVAVAADGRSVIFHIHPQARFHNGSPVLAKDVQHSFAQYMGEHTAPSYKVVLQDIAGIDTVDERTIRFRFKKTNRELPLTIGSLPIFSHEWGAGKPFNEIITDTPIGSGPYRIGKVDFGKDIGYERDPHYWAKDLNVNRGAWNFNRISIRIYADNTAKLEALKAGEFDAMQFFSAGDWTRRTTGKLFSKGTLTKTTFQHRQPAGFQSYVLNTRKPLLQDRRVRQALGLAVDYEWMNRQMFYNNYVRINGLFSNTDCAATGTPSPAELALLEPWRKQLPTEVFGAMTQPPITQGTRNGQPQSLRSNLKQAQTLLKAAGWRVQDGVLTNPQGQKMELEFLASSEGAARVVSPWARNLAKLGIQLTFRAVDFSLYQQRLRNFDYDIISLAFGGTHNPGQEYAEMFGSAAADMPDSGNYTGVKSPAADAIIEKLVAASTRDEMLTACRALDRIIAHGHYLVPQWASTNYRVVYNQHKLAYPAAGMPPYAGLEGWIMQAWWLKPSANTDKDAQTQ